MLTNFRFFITLDECPHLNGKHTIFGHLVSGQDVLDKMAKVDVDDEDKPLTPVLVARSGELERKRKTAPIKRVSPARVVSLADRGRRPSELENSPILPTKERAVPSDLNDKRKRRQSDNHIDENLRGRPRARSGDGSTTETAIESDHSRSPTSKHKRQRSPSPSRMLGRNKGNSKDADENHDHERRRRRSLPNQYDDENQARRDSERRDRHGDRRRSRERDQNRDDRRGPRDWDDPRSHERRDDRNDNYRPPRRQQDSYRPARNNRDGRNGRLDDGRLNNDGRLGAGADTPANDGGIKFKGRGSMKYREPDRKW